MRKKTKMLILDAIILLILLAFDQLTKYLVNSIGDASYNTQFLFTTHDVNLLSLKNFRQDEIWFIEKNKNGETRLKPFSDFDVTNEENILKDYLAGRFGAIPVIKEGM